MKPFLLLLALLAILATTRAVTSRVTTSNRGAQVAWNQCSSPCLCHYFSLQVWEYSSVTRTGGPSIVEDAPDYFYLYHQWYDNCAHTWGEHYVYNPHPLSNLTISRNSRSAQLGLTPAEMAPNNLLVSANITWSDLETSSNCNCRYIESSTGSFSLRQQSRSSSNQAEVEGAVSIGSERYTIPLGATGWVWDSGIKTISITHP
jgi:hypothetical protein